MWKYLDFTCIVKPPAEEMAYSLLYQFNFKHSMSCRPVSIS